MTFGSSNIWLNSIKVRHLSRGISNKFWSLTTFCVATFIYVYSCVKECKEKLSYLVIICENCQAGIICKLNYNKTNHTYNQGPKTIVNTRMWLQGRVWFARVLIWVCVVWPIFRPKPWKLFFLFNTTRKVWERSQ